MYLRTREWATGLSFPEQELQGQRCRNTAASCCIGYLNRLVTGVEVNQRTYFRQITSKTWDNIITTNKTSIISACIPSCPAWTFINSSCSRRINSLSRSTSERPNEKKNSMRKRERERDPVHNESDGGMLLYNSSFPWRWCWIYLLARRLAVNWRMQQFRNVECCLKARWIMIIIYIYLSTL